MSGAAARTGDLKEKEIKKIVGKRYNSRHIKNMQEHAIKT